MNKETAIKVLKELHDKSLFAERTALETLIPELAESEDEKIRKELISFLQSYDTLLTQKFIAWLEKQNSNANKEYWKGYREGKQEILDKYAELEKQGEQKPTLRERYKKITESEWFKKTHEGMSVSDDEKVDNINKIEPKFKVGDWIIYSNEEVDLITGFDDDGYFVDEEDYIPFYCEGNMRLFTIQDAKELKKIEQKPTQVIKPFEAEHGKYYYCIKDYFCGGRKQASKGDVVQALRGLPIMGLKDASEYFLPVNSIKCNFAWSEEDENYLNTTIAYLKDANEFKKTAEKCITWLKSLRPQNHWKPSDEQMKALDSVIDEYDGYPEFDSLVSLKNDLRKL